MLGYIFLAICAFGTVTCRTAGDCFSQRGLYHFCASDCGVIPGAAETYFRQCSEGLCCSDKESACANTDDFAWICKHVYIPLCKYRRDTGCTSSAVAPTPSTTKPTTTSTSTTTSTTTTTTTTTSTTTTTTTTTAPVTSKCGVKGAAKRSIDKRIVGGELAAKCEYPWQVLVSVQSALCGGSIIDEYTIVTAAHCIQPSQSIQPSDIRIDVGEHDLGDPSDQTTLPVESFTVHEKYNPSTFQNDIAIIKLQSPIEFNECVSPICLPEANQDHTGNTCEVSGWGTTSTGGSISYTLQSVELPIVSQQECQTVFTNTYITDLNICAGLTQGGKDACQGDSGGPLACPTSAGNYVLAGVVSWGDRCADPGKPGVYTDVSEYLDWIA